MVTIINNKTWEGSGVKKKVKCLGEQLFDKEFFFFFLLVPQQWYKHRELGPKRSTDCFMQGISQQPCNSTGTARNRMHPVISVRLQLPFTGGLVAV